MPKAKITKRYIDTLQPTGKLELHWDTELLGFGLQLTKAGAKSFVVRYLVDHKEKRIVIGRVGQITPDQARALARDKLTLALKGVDFVQEKKIKAKKAELEKVNTVENLYSEWLNRHVVMTCKPKTIDDYKRNFKLYVKEPLGSERVNDVTEDQIDRWHKALKKTPKAANYALRSLKACFNWGLRKKYRKEELGNPCKYIKFFEEQSRQAYLSPKELRSIGVAISELAGKEGGISDSAARVLLMLIFTGARSGEIRTLKWDYINYDLQMALLPDSKTGQKPLFLNAQAIGILQATPRTEDNPYCFSGLHGKGHLTTLKRPWKRVMEHAGISGYRIHDLRHSFASFGASQGQSLQMVGQLLGHKNTTTTEIYSHLFNDETQQSNNDIGGELSKALGHISLN